MLEQELIEITVVFNHHQIEPDFINLLESSGLVTIIIKDEQKFIHESQLQQLEKILSIHKELDIEISGIEVIMYMTQRIERMQQEINDLKNKIRFYELYMND